MSVHKARKDMHILCLAVDKTMIHAYCLETNLRFPIKVNGLQKVWLLKLLAVNICLFLD